MPDFDTAFFSRNAPEGSWYGALRPTVVRGFSHDTRTLSGGDCFIALKTAQRDGHTFLESAVAAGAAMALVSSPQTEVALPQFLSDDVLNCLHRLAHGHRMASDCQVVGITGSAGKTSTKDLLHRLLGEEALATQGNWNNTIGVPLTLLRIEPGQHRQAVIEAGIDRPGEMQLLAATIRPDVALVTSVGAAHLERLGTVNNVATEKARLLHAVGPDGIAIFPADCLQYPDFGGISAGHVWVAIPGRGEAIDLPKGYEGISFWTETNSKRTGGIRLHIAGPAHFVFSYELPAMSTGMLSNTVLAILAARACGGDDAEIAERLLDWQPTAKRGEWVKYATKRIYLDCYNANPLSMTDALSHFEKQSRFDGHRLFILATMNELGEASESWHREIGAKIPAGMRDVVLFVGPMGAVMEAGLRMRPVRPSAVYCCANVDEARDVFHTFMGTVFIKGSRTYALETLLEELKGSESGGVC